MFKLTHPLPQEYWVAVSGGVDSMAALHWLRKPRTNGLIGVVHINHGTDHATNAMRFVETYCKDNDIRCLTMNINGYPPHGESKEAWWRDERYKLFDSIYDTGDIILAHHMDDCLEEYIMCTMVRGYSATIPYRRGRCVRPFRMWKKVGILDYATRNRIPHVNDPSNVDTKYKRNYIRKYIVPNVLNINPGVYKLVKRVILEQDKNE